MNTKADCPSNVVERLISGHRPGYSLAQAFYKDTPVFQAELQTLWFKQWIFAGLECEIAEPGMWFKLDIGEASAIVIRSHDGAIRSFHNTCRHRGSRLCTADKGKSRNLTCPYHQWTYDSQGKLLFAKEMGDDFDKSEHALNAIHVEAVGGYIFINFASEPSSFEAFKAGISPYLQPHDLSNSKVVFESTIIENANWKLVVENNRECYHCGSNHPELLKTIAEVEDTTDPKCSPAYVQKSQADEQRWGTQKLPYQLIKDAGNGWQIVRVPMARGISFTMDGQPASSLLMGVLPDFDVGSVRLLHFPNTWNHALGDHALAFRVLPLDAQRTAVTTKWMVHKDAVEGVDYDLEKLTKVWLATNDQDKTLAENNQLGINSPSYRPGPYSQYFEYGVLAFVEWYLAAMREGLNDGH